ncbi:MAG: ABC transporter permease [Cyanobacteria bacterium SZAS LIN-3]|nr:ABC transporter permease [Cyanobacteria bacterium SZAS LIN-3]MBS2008331.1 ABC transporter permease [Cyanobacteria bacterium SZAS TMP-1]
MSALSQTQIFRLQIKTLAIKELRQIMRDRQLLFLLFFMPILQLCLYGFALSPEVEHLRLGVIDMARSPVSRELVAAMVENGVFDLQQSGGTTESLAILVREGKLDAGVVIPPELERDIKAQRKVEIQIMIDGVDANTAGIASGYISQILSAFNRHLVPVSRANSQLVLPQISFAYNPGLISSWFFVPGVLALVLNLVSTLVSTSTVVREKDSGTLEQLLMTPVNSFQILAAKVVPLSVLLMMTVLVSLLVARFIFHVPFRGSLLLFLGVSFLAIIVGISIGISLAAFAQNQRQALLTSFFVNLPVIQLSGAVAPLESMPRFCQYMSLMDPLRFYVSCTKAILLKGAGLDVIWPDVLALAVFASVLLTLSSRRFRRQLK